MAHQVFLSHATEDRDLANRVCASLEAEGICCWIAPRDVDAGIDYAAAILDAIRTADLVLLIFSAHADTSPYVLREIDRAVAYKRPVLALRVDETSPNASFEYYVNMWRTLDAKQGIEKKHEEVVAAVQAMISGRATAASTGGPAGGDSWRRPRWSRRRWVTTLVAAALVLAVVLGAVAFTQARGLRASADPAAHNSWTELKPKGTSPSPRAGMKLAYDSAHHKVILFGGARLEDGGELTILNDTWMYDPAKNTWKEMKPTLSPSPRTAPAMAYDSATDRVILFGGWDDTKHPYLRDTWAYDVGTNTWTKLEPAGELPAARVNAQMVLDTTTGRLLMFGGRGGFITFLNDIWAFDPTSNTWAKLEANGSLPTEREAPAAFDAVAKRLVVFGGHSIRGIETVLNDTWAFDVAARTWVELAPEGSVPMNRAFSSLVYEPSTRLMILFGGGGSNDTFAYDPAANTWADMSPEGVIPPTREEHAMVYESESGRILLFGGVSYAEGFLNDTWAYNP